MASDPLRSRRLGDRSLGAASTSTYVAPPAAADAYTSDKPTESAKPSSYASRPRKASLSDDRPLAKASRSRTGTTSWWSRVGGGLDVIQPGENRVLAGLVLLGAVVRYWHIARPSSVV